MGKIKGCAKPLKFASETALGELSGWDWEKYQTIPGRGRNEAGEGKNWELYSDMAFRKQISDHFGDFTKMVLIGSKTHPSSNARYRTFLDEEKDRIEEMRSLSEE